MKDEISESRSRNLDSLAVLTQLFKIRVRESDRPMRRITNQERVARVPCTRSEQRRALPVMLASGRSLFEFRRCSERSTRNTRSNPTNTTTAIGWWISTEILNSGGPAAESTRRPCVKTRSRAGRKHPHPGTVAAPSGGAGKPPLRSSRNGREGPRFCVVGGCCG